MPLWRALTIACARVVTRSFVKMLDAWLRAVFELTSRATAISLCAHERASSTALKLLNSHGLAQQLLTDARG